MPVSIREIGDCRDQYDLCVQVKPELGNAVAVAAEYGFELTTINFDVTESHAYGRVHTNEHYEKLVSLLAADPRVSWVEKCGMEKIGPRGGKR